jgi:hypothetical protein
MVTAVEIRRVLLLVSVFCLVVAPATSAVATSPPVDATSTSVQVASGAPVPQSPRIGPFREAAGESGVRAAWWLLVIGGAQVVALVLVTRRARARLPLRDDAP